MLVVTLLVEAIVANRFLSWTLLVLWERLQCSSIRTRSLTLHHGITKAHSHRGQFLQLSAALHSKDPPAP
jgi:hypothetical protein